MAITLDGTTGITTPGLTNTGSTTIVALTTTGNTILGDASTDTLNVGNGNLVTDASGNVGIGTTTPDALLHAYRISGKVATFGNNVNNNGNYIVLGGTVSTKNWVLANNMIVGGEFGVGRTSANGGTTIGSAYDLMIDSSGNTTITGTATGAKFIPSGSSATGNGIYLPAANSVGISTNGAERFRMNASGSAFFSGNYTVDYPGSGNTSTGIYLESAGQFCASRDNTVAGRFNRNSSDGILVSFARQGTEVGSVQITTTATSYVTSSDYRLKENIAPMTGALAKVALLKPVTYKWKSNGSDGQGFIAHELQAVVPDCVLGEKDGTQMQPYEITPAVNATYDEDGNELTPLVEAVMGEREVPKYQGIDTSFLVATLTAAIQEQQALITTLTDRIAALENK